MGQNDHWTWDVFISHNQQQKHWVRGLVHQCRTKGLRVFFDEDDIEPGEDVVRGIERGLQGSKHVVIIISPAALSSRWVAMETAISAFVDPDGSERKIIPVLLEPTPPDHIRPALQHRNIVNLTERSTRRAQYCKLFEFLGVAPAPPFPRMNARGRANRRASVHTGPRRPNRDNVIPFSPAILETGAMSPDSPFYIERRTDGAALAQLSSFEPTVTIRGYRKAGKSSLLNRIHHSARREGVRCFYLDFQGAGGALIQSTEHLFRQVAHTIVTGLGVRIDSESLWSNRLSPEANLTRVIEKGVLFDQQPIQLLFDEVDVLLRTSAGISFFSTLRYWHNLRATDHTGAWRGLRFAIAHASDPALWIPSTFQSPFNVGLPLELEDLTVGQVAELNRRLGEPLKMDAEIEALWNLIGGHPYLVRRSLHALSSSALSFPEFMDTAPSERGPLGSYLKLYFHQVMGDEGLLPSLREILSEGVCRDGYIFDRLWSIGLVVSPKPNVVRLRCKLYEDFFRSVLS